MSEIISKPYRLAPGTCERCVFGTGEHSFECLLAKCDNEVQRAVHDINEITGWPLMQHAT